ncbi:MAG: substrate-binding domain-containing protein, partial [Armatimonadota bacterium]
MKRVFLVVVVVLLCGLLLSSCRKPEPMPVGTPKNAGRIAQKASQAATGSLKIAVIPKGTTHEFWKSIHAGALKAAQELKVEIIWKGPLKEDSRDEQIKIVEDMTTQGVKGIVLAPLDDMALRLPVQEATKQGIPVVIIDSALKSEDYTSFVATDNRNGGKLAGEELARLLGGKGRVVMLRYQ